MDNMEYSLELLLNKLSHKTNMPLNAKHLKPKAVSYHFKEWEIETGVKDEMGNSKY